MTRVSRSVATFLAALLAVPGAAGAQERQWLRGIVTATTPASFVIYVRGLDLNITFAVVDSTVVMPKGLTHIRPPEHTRPEFSDLVKAGAVVEVHYSRTGRRNQADVVRLSVKEWQEAGRSVVGRVAAVSRDSLTVDVDGRQRSFALIASTRLAPGVRPDAGRSERLEDLVAEHDSVLVLYKDEGSVLTATEICVLSRFR